MKKTTSIPIMAIVALCTIFAFCFSPAVAAPPKKDAMKAVVTATAPVYTAESNLLVPSAPDISAVAVNTTNLTLNIMSPSNAMKQVVNTGVKKGGFYVGFYVKGAATKMDPGSVSTNTANRISMSSTPTFKEINVTANASPGNYTWTNISVAGNIGKDGTIPANYDAYNSSGSQITANVSNNIQPQQGKKDAMIKNDTGQPYDAVSNMIEANNTFTANISGATDLGAK